MSDFEEVLGETQANDTVQPEAEQQPAAAPETPADTQPEAETPPEPTVPVAVFTSVRGEMKAELESLRAQLAEAQQPRQAPEPVKVPDVLEDQEGFAAHLQTATAQAIRNTQLDLMEDSIRDKHGDDAVNEAMAAAQAAGAMPSLSAQKNPWRGLMKWHQDNKVAQEVGPDPTAYRAKVEAEVRAKIEAEMAAKVAQEMAAKAPPSMASTNGGGGSATQAWAGPANFESIFGE